MSIEHIKSSQQISWTSNELHQWINLGLIKIELLNSERKQELLEFICSNITMLRSHYKQNEEELDSYITLPLNIDSQREAYELPVINKKTGQIIETLTRIETFEVAEGIFLQVSAKEIDLWKKETAKAKEFTKEQNNSLKKNLFQSRNIRSLSKEELIKLIKEIDSPKKSKKVRHSAPFVKIKTDYVEPKYQAQRYGIRLSPTEDKMMNAIYNLLHDKSENRNTNSESFYAGNGPYKLVSYGPDGQTATSACLVVREPELIKEYLGTTKYSGKQAINARDVFRALCDKKYLIRYKKIRKTNNGDKAVIIEDDEKMLKVNPYIEGMSEDEVAILEKGDPDEWKKLWRKKGGWIIRLHPVITDQINSVYVEYPHDINHRTAIASGGHLNITESIIALRDYCLELLSKGINKQEANIERLVHILKLDSYYLKESKKKKIDELISDAIKANRNLGLIINAEHKKGANGQFKYIFTLNENFNKG